MGEEPIAAGKSSFDLVDPGKVFAELHLQPDSVMLDIACGNGRYALAAAEIVTEKGAIHAIDLWKDGVDQLRREAERRGYTQIHPRVGDVGETLPLAVASVDTCLMATVLHDLVVAGTAAGALAEVARVLKPDGRLVIIEFDKMESDPGPPAAIRLSPGEVEELVAPFGFLEEHIVPVGPTTYLISFLKK